MSVSVWPSLLLDQARARSNSKHSLAAFGRYGLTVYSPPCPITPQQHQHINSSRDKHRSFCLCSKAGQAVPLFTRQQLVCNPASCCIDLNSSMKKSTCYECRNCVWVCSFRRGFEAHNSPEGQPCLLPCCQGCGSSPCSIAPVGLLQQAGLLQAGMGSLVSLPSLKQSHFGCIMSLQQSINSSS